MTGAGITNRTRCYNRILHYTDVIMTTMTYQITSLTAVYSIVYSDADQRKYQSSASLAFVSGIHRGPVNSPHKGPVTRGMFPFDDVIMVNWYGCVDSLIGAMLETGCHLKAIKKRKKNKKNTMSISSTLSTIPFHGQSVDMLSMWNNLYRLTPVYFVDVNIRNGKY